LVGSPTVARGSGGQHDNVCDILLLRGRLTMTVIRRNNVRVSGRGRVPLVLVHGFGIDQRAWDRILPAFEEEYRVLRYDLTGLGSSDLAAYDRERHGTLQGHAQDLLEICHGLGVQDGLVVGHSVGAIISLLAAEADASLFRKVVLLAGSPRYLNDVDYPGGFEREQAEQVIAAVAADYIAWCNNIVPIVVGEHAAKGTAEHVLSSFRRVDPDVATHFFRVTLFADHRDALQRLKQPTLVLQASRDAFVPVAVGRYMADHLPRGELHVLSGHGGHFPHLGAPQAVVAAVQEFFDHEPAGA
jgi:sigma-B regulation protein RsbQ